MSILTNGEIYTAYIEAADQTLRPQDERIALAFARAVEQAVIAKLAAGVNVESVGYTFRFTDVEQTNISLIHPNQHYRGYTELKSLYSEDQLQTAIAAAWVAGYYQAGYTYDGAYADKMSDEFAAEWCKKAAIEGALK